MELTVRPADLHAAAAVLAGLGARLDDAGLTFARQAQGDLPEIGAELADSIARGTVDVERAVQVIATDIERLAAALGALAHHYPLVDRTAVSRR